MLSVYSFSAYATKRVNIILPLTWCVGDVKRVLFRLYLYEVDVSNERGEAVAVIYIGLYRLASIKTSWIYSLIHSRLTAPNRRWWPNYHIWLEQRASGHAYLLRAASQRWVFDVCSIFGNLDSHLGISGSTFIGIASISAWNGECIALRCSVGNTVQLA